MRGGDQLFPARHAPVLAGVPVAHGDMPPPVRAVGPEWFAADECGQAVRVLVRAWWLDLLTPVAPPQLDERLGRVDHLPVTGGHHSASSATTSGDSASLVISISPTT